MGFVKTKPDKAPPKFVYNRPKLYPKQLEAIFNPLDFESNPARYSMIEASTKAGKTHGCICWLFEQALMHGKPGRNFWWVAPVYPQAEIAFGRMKRALPPWLYKAISSPLQITLLNGAVIMFKSGEKPDNLYGEDVWAAVIDEASRVREEAFNAIRSTLTATRGPMRAIGNVKGRKNWFFRMAQRAKGGAAGYSYHKMTAYDAVAGGVLDLAEVEDAKAMLPENVFRELYLAEPSDDGGNPFGMKHIATCVRPMSDAAPVAIGTDLAKSYDWTVALGLDKIGDTCGFERWQGDWERTTDRVIDLIGNTPSLIDQTGVGNPIVERIQKKCKKAEGFTFSAKSKQQLMEGLAVAIQRGEVGYPEGVIRDELENFEYVYTRTGVLYSAPEGYHDDCVMALALAVEARRRLNLGMAGVKPLGDKRVSPWLGSMSAPDDE